MKTLTSPSAFEALVNRLAVVTPHDTARWGRMNAYQMLRHLSDAIRVPLGEKQVSDASGLFQRTLMKWGALYIPTPWPKNVPTPPQIDQCRLGITNGDFEPARQDALTQLSRLHNFRNTGVSHPLFGTLSYNEWMRWGWLHTDHHLRQFGR